MLNFIWHLRGSARLSPTATDAAVLDSVEHLLKQQRKSPERGSTSIIFEAPLGGDLFGGWRAMTIYDRGRFWIEQSVDDRRLRYDLRSLHIMIFCLCGSLMFFLFGLAGGFFGGLKLGVIMFAWVYGMNVLLALLRVPLLIRGVVQPR